MIKKLLLDKWIEESLSERDGRAHLVECLWSRERGSDSESNSP